MSFKIDCGDGRLKDVEIKNGLNRNLNSYARVVEINQKVFTIDNVFDGDFNNFTAGEKVLIHVSATNGTDASNLGRFLFAEIEYVNGNLLTLSENFDCDLNYFYVQLISVPQFRNLTLKNATLTPQNFDVFKFTGGLMVAQVQDTFKMENSNIDLTDCGIPTQKKLTYRPLTEFELSGETDGSKFAGTENLSPCILNSGDGLFFIQCGNFAADSASRIGNPKTHGRAGCRGAADSAFKPSNVTNIGGSSIFIAAENFNAPVEILAKYRNADLPAGRGICRSLIATNTILPNDEKLYHFEILADESRVQKLGIENFGNGTLGNFVNPEFKLNNFAEVEVVVGNKLYLKNKTLNGIAPFKTGSLVMLRKNDGEFFISRVVECGDNFILIEKTFEAVEVLTIPEFENLTLDNFSTDKILAVAVADIFNVGTINAAKSEKFGNCQSWNKCNGIFILAKNINFNENSRLNSATTIITENMTNFSEDIFDINFDNFIYNS